MSASIPPNKISASSKPTVARTKRLATLSDVRYDCWDREAWQERARADMHRLKSEDLSAEADAWEYDAEGNIQIVGTNLTVQARPADRP